MDSLTKYSYDEMLEKAAATSPDAKPVFIHGRWYIVITAGTEPSVLDDRFSGTPVWELTQNGTYPQPLKDWAGRLVYVMKNVPDYLRFMPLEAIAEFYNLDHQRTVIATKKRDVLLEGKDIDLPNLSDEDYEIYIHATRQAYDEANEEISAERQQFDARWENAGKF